MDDMRVAALAPPGHANCNFPFLACGFDPNRENGAGALTAWIPFAIYFRGHNALGEFVDAYLTYNFYYAAATYVSAYSRGIDAVVLILQPLASVVVCVIVGATFYVSGCIRAGHNRMQEERGTNSLWFWWPLTLLWVVFDLAGALVCGRRRDHRVRERTDGGVLHRVRPGLIDEMALTLLQILMFVNCYKESQ